MNLFDLSDKDVNSQPPSAKRMRRDVTDNASPIRASTKNPDTPSAAGSKRTLLTRSNLLSPTAASLARSRSTQDLRRSNIPALKRAPSTSNLSSRRAAVTAALALPVPPALPAALNSSAPKSILRSPHRLYSTDPSKIAAGTHLATPTPPRVSAAAVAPAASEPPGLGKTAKRVDFTASARLKALRDEAKATAGGASASASASAFATPAAAPAPLEPPATAMYPDLSARAAEALAETRARAPPAAAPAAASFTFRVPGSAAAPAAFGRSTIRAVREDSDVGAPPPLLLLPQVAGVKRKMGVEPEGEASDKENGCEGGGGGEERPAKKARREGGANVGAAKSKVMAKAGTGKAGAGAGASRRRVLSAARLNYLARPKRLA
jgi:hypothetical protein